MVLDEERERRHVEEQESLECQWVLHEKLAYGLRLEAAAERKKRHRTSRVFGTAALLLLAVLVIQTLLYSSSSSS